MASCEHPLSAAATCTLHSEECHHPHTIERSPHPPQHTSHTLVTISTTTYSCIRPSTFSAAGRRTDIVCLGIPPPPIPHVCTDSTRCLGISFETSRCTFAFAGLAYSCLEAGWRCPSHTQDDRFSLSSKRDLPIDWQRPLASSISKVQCVDDL